MLADGRGFCGRDDVAEPAQLPGDEPGDAAGGRGGRLGGGTTWSRRGGREVRGPIADDQPFELRVPHLDRGRNGRIAAVGVPVILGGIVRGGNLEPNLLLGDRDHVEQRHGSVARGPRAPDDRHLVQAADGEVLETALVTLRMQCELRVGKAAEAFAREQSKPEAWVSELGVPFDQKPAAQRREQRRVAQQRMRRLHVRRQL